MWLVVLLSCLGGCWGQYDPNMVAGTTTIVHLFEWRWTDIAAECERYLAPNGFGAVQISPPNEHIVLSEPRRPWWERYQPVSYKLCSRSGSESQFIDMVARCNNVGVRIYADVVINHMCGAGGGSGTHSSCGSYFSAATREFPSVPYSPPDFNDDKCTSPSGDIENYNDVNQVRNCRLVSLLDLALEKPWVRARVLDYLNHMLQLGVAGFRVDACKHMWPGDLEAIMSSLNPLNTRWFSKGARPFIYQEVIDLGGEPIKASQYFGLGRVTEFKYGSKLGRVVRGWDGERMSYLRNWGEGWSFMPSDRSLVFIDNHDTQRGHGPGGSSVLTFWEPRLYKVAVAFMLAHPYGVTRVMSSYRWDRRFVNGKDENDWMGPPSEADGSTRPVTIRADSTCGDGWVCEHRWRQIRNMVVFRNAVGSQPLRNWWDNGGNMVAFGRGDRGFIAINMDNWPMEMTLQTALPAGVYCDVISGQRAGDRCTGLQVTVNACGNAVFHISNDAQDPMVAIHIHSRL
ncbi:pancreatic alpha-amylase-like [Amblyraja radiata]|uniref:pancreatic alpha-amylase-like n=1 Tax=Amblyraja radiata TaxID=386614 RepID=UPI001402D64A|nr:pancreatic alpha-amylase-like [Amblyraja radiata]